MPWTATLAQPVLVTESHVTAVVLFTDGVQYKRLETFDLLGHTLASLQATVEARRAQLEQSYAFLVTAQVDGITFTPPVPPDPPKPTDAELARQAFLAAYARLQGLARAVACGLLAADDPTVTTAVKDARATWDPQYILDL